MKRNKSIHRELLIRFLLAALIPILLFAGVTQINIWGQQRRSVDEKIEGSLRNSDKGLDLLVEKYAIVLQGICSREKVLTLTERMSTGKASEAERQQLYEIVCNECRQYEGVEGVVLAFPNGDIMGCSESSRDGEEAWADKLEPPGFSMKTSCRAYPDAITVNGEERFLFQVNGLVIDKAGGNAIYGAAAVLIDERTVREVLDSVEDSRVYLLDKGRIVSAPERESIGKESKDVLDEKRNRYTERLNGRTGVIICNEQSLEAYYESFQSQMWFLGVAGLLILAISFALAYSFTRPYLRAVDAYSAAQRRFENGDFSTRVYAGKGLPDELQKIAEGFNKVVVRTESLVERTKQVAEEQRLAELSALEAQIDPHFLYNTLDAINWKAIENEQYEISELLGAMADVFRHSVKNTGGITTLGKAIGWLEHYILLQSVKLGKRPELVVNVPENLRDFRMHKLLLQPFVENAVKYAFLEKEGACILTVEAKMAEEQLHVMIEDNGSGMEEEVIKKINCGEEIEGHMGISNVRKRLKLYYGDDATVYFESVRGCYTRVHLFIPMMEETTPEI